MAKLTMLQIDKLRDVEPTVLHFHPRRNVLLGKNGSGKTRLLELISMIVRSDFTALAAEEFDFTFELQDGDAQVWVHMQNERADEVAPLLPGFQSLRPEDAYEPSAVIKVLRGGEIVARIRGSRQQAASRFFQTPLAYGYWAAMVGRHSVYPAGFETHRFDEALDLYRIVYETPKWPITLSHDVSSGRLFALRGELLSATVRKDLFERQYTEDRVLVWRDHQLPFLKKAIDQLGFASAEYLLEPESGEKTQYSDEATIVYGSFKVRLTWSGGDFISNKQLSYGQKRLLAFMHYLDCNPDYVIADELVNGLHHEWIDFCLDEIGDRQAFLTSQNPLLFDYLQFDTAQDVKDQFILCSVEPKEGRRRMHWRQMSDEKAAAFHGAYKRGIQYVSEILQSEALW